VKVVGAVADPNIVKPFLCGVAFSIISNPTRIDEDPLNQKLIYKKEAFPLTQEPPK
jgi:hypothetical protein